MTGRDGTTCSTSRWSIPSVPQNEREGTRGAGLGDYDDARRDDERFLTKRARRDATYTCETLILKMDGFRAPPRAKVKAERFSKFFPDSVANDPALSFNGMRTSGRLRSTAGTRLIARAPSDVRSARVHVLTRRPIGGDAPRESHRGTPGRTRVLPRDPRGGGRALDRGGDPPLVLYERRRAARRFFCRHGRAGRGRHPRTPPPPRRHVLVPAHRLRRGVRPHGRGQSGGMLPTPRRPARVPRRRQIMELLRRKVARFRRVHEPPRVCRRSPHAEETPEARAEPEQRPRDVGPRPRPSPSPSRRRCHRRRRGAVREVSPRIPAATTPRARRRRRRTFPRRRQNARPPPTNPADPDAVQICRNKGCGEKFTEAENRDDACAYHPGPPIFHERKKGWSCCDRICYDFDEFMRIPPCTWGRHDANRGGSGAGEYGKRTQK